MTLEEEFVVPPFLEELTEEEVSFDVALRFVEEIEGAQPAPSSGGRTGEELLARIAGAPLKYGPFYERVALLLGAQESEVEELLGPDGFRRSPLRGIKYKKAPLRTGEKGQAATVVYFAPGTKYPHHTHDHHERLLVLEGGYTDSSGEKFGPGDLHEMLPGTEHGFLVDADGPCVAVAVADEKLRFTSPFLRFLARLIGR